MKRHQSLVVLSREHHNVLILAQLIKKDAPEYKDLPRDPEGKKEYTLEFYKNELKHHMALEDKVLIPSVSGIDLEVDEALSDISHEHKKIRKQVKKLKIAEGDELIKRLDKLGCLLEAHVRKEERELFQKIQEILPEEVLKDLEKDLKAKTVRNP